MYTYPKPSTGTNTFSVFDTHTAGIRPIQKKTDFRQTKIVVRSVARASGESNAREWWVPVRVSARWVCV